MENIKKITSNHHIVIWGIFIIGFIVRGYGLSEQPPLDDEVGAAFAASNYMEHGSFGQVMWYHPPLRNIVVFLSGKLFGEYTAWGLRGGSIIFGSFTVLLLGYLTYSLFRNKMVSYLSSFFLCIDPLHISISRQAFQEATTPFFIVAGVLSAYHSVRKDNIFYCYLSGLFFGIGSASKWHGLFPWAASAAAYLIVPWIIKDYKGSRNIFVRGFNVLAAYVAVPIVVYIAVYLPWFNRGNSLSEFVNLQLWLVKHQYYHIGQPYSEISLSRRAYHWFLLPVAWIEFVFYQGKGYLNIAMGNFLTWVLTLPSLYFSAKIWFKTKTFNLGYLIALFLISYIPLVLTARSIWVLAAPPTILFAFILSAYTISTMIDRKIISIKILAIYISVVIALSALMYPMSTLRALEYSYLKPLAEMYSPHTDKEPGASER